MQQIFRALVYLHEARENAFENGWREGFSSPELVQRPSVAERGGYSSALSLGRTSLGAASAACILSGAVSRKSLLRPPWSKLPWPDPIHLVVIHCVSGASFASLGGTGCRVLDGCMTDVVWFILYEPYSSCPGFSLPCLKQVARRDFCKWLGKDVTSDRGKTFGWRQTRQEDSSRNLQGAPPSPTAEPVL